MHLLQNLKQKSVARKSMILLAAITLSAAVATNALAAGHGGVAALEVAADSEGATLEVDSAVDTWVAALLEAAADLEEATSVVAVDSLLDISAVDRPAAA